MLQDLELRQFRCHANLRLAFQPGWNLILGTNGGGKSSILEAVYYLGRLKSFRTASTREMVRWEQSGFHLSIQHTFAGNEEELAIRWEKGARTCKINGRPAEKLEEYWGRIPVVLLTTDDQALIRGPAMRRQQWLDSLLAYGNSNYLGWVQRYNTTLRHRNAWLRQGAADRRMGEALTAQLTETGRRMTTERGRMLEQLQPLLHSLAARLMPGDPGLAWEYRPSFPTGQDPEWPHVRGNEQRLGRTLLGPHRDEIAITLRGQPLARFGSEGEQRLGVLLMRLSEVHAIHQFRGRWPALLLDDVLSPLDASRKLAWTREIPPEVQIILATTGWPSDFATPEKWTAWELTEGVLHPL